MEYSVLFSYTCGYLLNTALTTQLCYQEDTLQYLTCHASFLSYISKGTLKKCNHSCYNFLHGESKIHSETELRLEPDLLTSRHGLVILDQLYVWFYYCFCLWEKQTNKQQQQQNHTDLKLQCAICKTSFRDVVSHDVFLLCRSSLPKNCYYPVESV